MPRLGILYFIQPEFVAVRQHTRDYRVDVSNVDFIFRCALLSRDEIVAAYVTTDLGEEPLQHVQTVFKVYAHPWAFQPRPLEYRLEREPTDRHVANRIQRLAILRDGEACASSLAPSCSDCIPEFLDKLRFRHVLDEATKTMDDPPLLVEHRFDVDEANAVEIDSIDNESTACERVSKFR